KGTGSRTKVAKEVQMLIISCSRPIAPPKKTYIPTTLMSMKQNATGIPVSIKTTRLPNMSNSTSCHSNGVYLIV
ncbi:hypothetical protein KA005_48680, partial [bacterium]|nr:hypothetical protein [bacterium]